MTEEALKKAARLAGAALLDSLPPPEDCDHVFAPVFEKKMSRLLRRARHMGLYTALRRIACFLLAGLIGGSVWLTVDAQARERFFGWVREETKSTSQHYFYEGESADEAENVRYRLPEIPEGYSELDVLDSANGQSFLYANDDGEILDFGYLTKRTKTTSSDIFFQTDGMEKKQVAVHGLPADFYLDTSGKIANGVVWVDREADVLCYLSGYLSEEDLIALAESVTQEK